MWDFCQLWLCQFPYVSIRAPHSTLAGHAWAPYRSRRIWKTLKIPVRGPYDACTGIARGTLGVLRIIQPSHKYADVSSRTGPIAWCDHGNSSNVKFLWALHSALRARNRMGDKIVRDPWLDVTEGLRHWTIYFTNNFLLTVHIGWKLYHAVIQSVAIRSKPLSTRATTAQLSGHVQIFIVIT